jgi:Chalcone isomerase-like
LIKSPGSKSREDPTQRKRLSPTTRPKHRVSPWLNDSPQSWSAGESFALDSVPGQGTFIRLNGERVSTIEGTAFFGCLMSAYLGQKPADATLKRTLLGDKAA